MLQVQLSFFSSVSAFDITSHLLRNHAWHLAAGPLDFVLDDSSVRRSKRDWNTHPRIERFPLYGGPDSQRPEGLCYLASIE